MSSLKRVSGEVAWWELGGRLSPAGIFSELRSQTDNERKVRYEANQNIAFVSWLHSRHFAAITFPLRRATTTAIAHGGPQVWFSVGNWPDFDWSKSGQIILLVFRSKPLWLVKEYMVKSRKIEFFEADDEWNCSFTAKISNCLLRIAQKKVLHGCMTFFLTPRNDVLLDLESFLALHLKITFVCVCLVKCFYRIIDW